MSAIHEAIKRAEEEVSQNKQVESPMETVFEITRSATFGKLVAALAKAQLRFKPILKQNENAAFTRGTRISYYADLATYIDATQEALASEGLVVMQWPDVSLDAKSMTLVSILAHSSGEWIQGRLSLPALGRDGFTAQSCGSSITYARRYSYAAITGCAAEDDDANAASGRGTSEAAQEVGKRKVEDLKAKQNGGIKPTTLFFTYPDRHNGNYAEWVNLKEYANSLDEVAAEGLRQLFKPFLSASLARSGASMVPKEKMAGLLEKLAGDVGIDVKELQPT